MLTPYAPKGVEKLNQRFVDTKKPPMWVGMDVWGATICFNTVEAQKRNLPKPETLEGPAQAGLQGPDHHAAPGLQRHRLPRRHRVAAALRRGRRLEVHGRAAREHRAVRALGLQALPPGRRRRVRDGHLVRVPRQRHQGRGRADRPHLPEGRRGLGHGSLGDHEDDQEAGRGASKLLDWVGHARRRTSSTPRTTRSSRCPAWRKPLPNVPANYETAAGEERLRLGGEEPRPHPRRVEQALRRQSRSRSERGAAL